MTSTTAVRRGAKVDAGAGNRVVCRGTVSHRAVCSPFEALVSEVYRRKF
jgi:hypothetical protein